MLSGVVEADETFVGGKLRKNSGAKEENSTKVRQGAH